MRRQGEDGNPTHEYAIEVEPEEPADAAALHRRARELARLADDLYGASARGSDPRDLEALQRAGVLAQISLAYSQAAWVALLGDVEIEPTAEPGDVRPLLRLAQPDEDGSA